MLISINTIILNRTNSYFIHNDDNIFSNYSIYIQEETPFAT